MNEGRSPFLSFSPSLSPLASQINFFKRKLTKQQFSTGYKDKLMILDIYQEIHRNIQMKIIYFATLILLIVYKLHKEIYLTV